MSLKKYFELAEKDIPKPTKENKVSPMGNPYVWFAYDFDEINEWMAKWIQNHEEQMSILNKEVR